MDKKTVLGIVGVVVLVALGAWLVLAGDDETETDTVTQPSEQTQQDQSAQPSVPEEDGDDADGEAVSQEFDVGMQNFSFTPDELRVNAGETVTVNLTNNGGTHDFVIDELGVQSELISGGDTTSVTFTVPEDAAGQTYAFYCSVGNHRAQGMEGQLVVSAAATDNGEEED